MLSPGTILVTVVVAALLVGTKRIRSLGEDLGAALRSFRKGLQGEIESQPEENLKPTDKTPPNTP